MKLLFILPEFPPDYGGGIATFYRELLPALCSLGCEVSVLKGSAFAHGGSSYRYHGIPVSVLRTDLVEKWTAHFAHFAMFPELRRNLSAAFALHEQAHSGTGFDVVEVTDWGMLFLPWLLSSRARVLLQMHGSTGQIAFHDPAPGHEAEGITSLLLEHVALRSAPALSSHSRANTLWWQSQLGRSVEYIPPPFAAPDNESPRPPCGDRWLTVGRIQSWKGPQVACQAWEQLGKHAPALDWFGRDTWHAPSNTSTDAWLHQRYPGIWRRKIIPSGQLPPAEITARVKTARAVLVPSTWDVFNLFAAEAMALGKTVLISDAAGASELVEHGVNGFVFPSGNAAALADLVRKVQSLDDHELHEIGCKAALTVRAQLHPHRIAKARLALLNRPPQPSPAPLHWMRDWLLGGTPCEQFSFLNSLPLKELTTHVLQRTLKKLRSAAVLSAVLSRSGRAGSTTLGSSLSSPNR